MKTKLFYGLEDDDTPSEETDESTDQYGDPVSNETDDESVSSSDGDMPDDGMSDNPDDMDDPDGFGEDDTDSDKINDNPIGPLNTLLVYRKQELEENQKTNLPQYKLINNILDARDDGKDPIASEILANADLKSSPSNKAVLLDDETTSDPDDDDAEQYEKFEYEDLSIESYLDRFYRKDQFNNLVPITEAWDTDSSRVRDGVMYDRLGDAVGTVAGGVGRGAKAVGRGIKGAAGAAGRGAKATGKLAGKGAQYAGKNGLIGASVVGKKLSENIKKDMVSLNRFIDKHKNNYSGLLRKLTELKKEVFIRNKLPHDGQKYNNVKVLEKLLIPHTNDLVKIISSQLPFYKEIGIISINGVRSYEKYLATIIDSVNSEEMINLSLNKLITKNLYEHLMKKDSHDDEFDSKETTTFESKLTLPGNKVLLGAFPKSGISTYSEYFEALASSKLIIFSSAGNLDYSINYLNKKELLELIDTTIKLVKMLEESSTVFNKLTGTQESILKLTKHFNLLEKSKQFASLDKKQREIIKDFSSSYLKYTNQVYLDPYLNINNMYFNDVKYLVHFVKAHL